MGHEEAIREASTIAGSPGATDVIAFLGRWLLFLTLNILVGATALVWASRLWARDDTWIQRIVTWLTLVVSLVLGLQLLLGILGTLTPRAEVVVLLILLVVSLRTLPKTTAKQVTRYATEGCRRLRIVLRHCVLRRRSPIHVAVLCFLLVLVIAALAEPATMYDALAYHMPMVVEWTQNQGLTTFYLPFSDYANSYFPGNGQLLYLWSFAPLQSDLFINCTRLALWGLLGVAASYTMQELGVAGSLADTLALTLMLTPVALSQALDQSLDVANAAFLLMSLGHLLRTRRSLAVRHAVLLGLSMGCALGMKYSGPAHILLLSVSLLFVLCERRRQIPHWRSLILIGAVVVVGTVALGGYWYVRNLVVS